VSPSPRSKRLRAVRCVRRPVLGQHGAKRKRRKSCTPERRQRVRGPDPLIPKDPRAKKTERTPRTRSISVAANKIFEQYGERSLRRSGRAPEEAEKLKRPGQGGQETGAKCQMATRIRRVKKKQAKHFPWGKTRKGLRSTKVKSRYEAHTALRMITHRGGANPPSTYCCY